MPKTNKSCLLTFFFCSLAGMLGAQEAGKTYIEAWLTNSDRSSLFSKQPEKLFFANDGNRYNRPSIVIDDYQQMQGIDGFGFALTGGSAGHLIRMNNPERSKILNELFRQDENNIGVSYLRITIGASDLNSFVFSYDDFPEGKSDFNLAKFSLSQDLNDVVPVLKEILAINPSLKILASPWSAPAWMKTAYNVRGGKLRKECYGVYSRYFVKYIQEMEKEGIKIDAVTIQNEPLNSRNTPSMAWIEDEQADFIKNYLGPAFVKSQIKTKIVLFDHNCDRPDFPLYLLNDPDVAGYADGTGFHHYAGEMEALSMVHAAHPEKNLYFTEQMVTERPGSSEIAIANPVKSLIIGATRNWSRNVILWNLAADPLNDPHTDNGGCSMCQGAVTISGNMVTRNLAYYTVAHASKFVRPGSVRIASTGPGDKSVALYQDEQRPGVYRAAVNETVEVMPNVAFKTPDNRIVLIVVNDSFSEDSFRIQWRGKFSEPVLRPGSVGTYIWEAE